MYIADPQVFAVEADRTSVELWKALEPFYRAQNSPGFSSELVGCRSGLGCAITPGLTATPTNCPLKGIDRKLYFVRHSLF